MGLPFNVAKVANVIKLCLKGKANWDSEKLGPIDAADLLVQAQEERFFFIARDLVKAVSRFDKLPAPKLKPGLPSDRKWERHSLYVSDMPWKI